MIASEEEFLTNGLGLSSDHHNLNRIGGPVTKLKYVL